MGKQNGKQFPARNEIPEGRCPCDFCEGRCCQYISLPIDTPDCYADYDNLRWYLSHGKISVYKSGDAFYLMVANRCNYLGKDNRCEIYETRPQICRDYSSKTCEYMEQNPFDGYFELQEQVEEYAEAVLGPRPGHSFRSPRPSGSKPE